MTGKFSETWSKSWILKDEQEFSCGKEVKPETTYVFRLCVVSELAPKQAVGRSGSACMSPWGRSWKGFPYHAKNFGILFQSQWFVQFSQLNSAFGEKKI